MKCKMCNKENLAYLIGTNNKMVICENCAATYEVIIEQKTETDDFGLRLTDIKKFLFVGLQ